jgi:hypothetical protein
MLSAVVVAAMGAAAVAVATRRCPQVVVRLAPRDVDMRPAPVVIPATEAVAIPATEVADITATEAVVIMATAADIMAAIGHMDTDGDSVMATGAGQGTIATGTATVTTVVRPILRIRLIRPIHRIRPIPHIRLIRRTALITDGAARACSDEVAFSGRPVPNGAGSTAVIIKLWLNLSSAC